MVCPAIDNLASREILAVIRFLYAKNMRASEIHRELCSVCDQNIMSEGTAGQRRRKLQDGRTNVYDREQSGRPSVVNDDLVQNVDQKVYERRYLTISGLSCEFTSISRNLLYEIITDRLGCYKFCARWAPKMLTKSSGCTCIHQTSRKFLKKRCVPAGKLMATVFWDRKGVLMVEFMQQGTTITSEVYCESLKKLRRAIQKKGVECSYMTMHIRIQLLPLEHCWSVSTGSCLATLLIALMLLRVTTPSLPA
jgi:hypothetical protein